MRRVLCQVETLYVRQRSRAVLSCTLRGRLDAEALSTVFDDVTEAHPSLRSRTVPDGEGFAMHLLEEAERPRLSVRTGAVEDTFPTELNTSLPFGGPLSRATLVHSPDGEEHAFVLSVDHSIVDGRSAMALLNEVWERYRKLVEDGERPGDADRATAYPPSISELLPPADPEKTAAYLLRRTDEVRRSPAELIPFDIADPTGVAERGEGRIESALLALDAERTDRLRRTARATGVSVHALITAALLATARRHLPGDEPRVLGCLSPVDLRSRLSPPAPALMMIPAVTTHLQTLDVAPDADPFELARTVHARLGEFLAGDEPFQEIRITPEIPRNPFLQLATVIATNMGVLPGPRLPEGLEITGMRLLPGRENYFPAAGRSPVMACVVSVDGRLTIEFPFFTACFSPELVQGFCDGVGTVLDTFTEAAGPAPAPAD
ncbi:condensation domain-containing protein [Streptomyces sp. NPDC046203]|uniref:phthiocerol/phthiodiolone dimycocerosyl transferase family protein n=1 Tax=Streptomyces sp. NPDC046203 TaxID=3154602 RepID=UPI0033F0F9C7